MNLCVSYPKSGRTWLRAMLAELGVQMKFTHLDTGADDRSWGKRFDRLAQPESRAERTVFLHRDPRDVVTSFFYEMTRRQKPPLGHRLRYLASGRWPPRTMASFVRSPRFGIEKTVVFNLRCAAQLDAWTVSYEEMRAEPVTGLAGILSYLGEDVSPDRIAGVVEANSFSRMKEMEARGEAPRALAGRLGATDPGDPNSFKVRKGKIGGWRDEMDAETQAFANEVLERYGYFGRIAELTARGKRES